MKQFIRGKINPWLEIRRLSLSVGLKGWSFADSISCSNHQRKNEKIGTAADSCCFVQYEEPVERRVIAVAIGNDEAVAGQFLTLFTIGEDGDQDGRELLARF